MPRAAQFTQATEDDFIVLKGYLVERMGQAIQKKVRLIDNVFLTDDPYTTNYVPYLLVPLPELKYQIMIHGSGIVAYGYKAMRIAAVDVVSSELMLIDYDGLIRVMEQAKSQGGQYGDLLVQEQSGWNICTMGSNWMVESKLAVVIGKLGEGRDSFLSYRSTQRRQPEQFVHLHCHSTKSLLDGVSMVENIPWQAKLNGQPGIALTDHGNMFGAYKFNNACKENGVKPIFGVEGYLVDKVGHRYIDKHGTPVNFTHHITIIVSNQTGWENLCELLTIAGRDHFYYHPIFDYELLARYSEGLIILTGCFKGVASWYCQKHDPVITAEKPWCRFDLDRARQFLRWAKSTFEDRVYGEMMAIPDFVRYDAALPLMKQLFVEEGIPPIVTVDCHYEVAEDASIQAILSKISKDKVEEVRGKIGNFWIKPASMIQHPCFEPSDLARTCEVMERCGPVDMGKRGEYLFPEYKYGDDIDWQAYLDHKAKST